MLVSKGQCNQSAWRTTEGSPAPEMLLALNLERAIQGEEICRLDSRRRVE